MLVLVLGMGTRVDFLFAADQPDLDITLPALSGESVRLSDYSGKVIVLNFWASWCFPCRYEMPSLQKIHDRFNAQGLVVIAVAVDDELVPAQTFQAKYGFTFPMLFDAEGVAKLAMNVSGVPQTYIIDRAGNLISVRDPATGVSSPLIDNPMVWEGEEIIELLSEIVSQ